MDLIINVDDLIEEFNLPEETGNRIVQAAVQAVTNAIYYNWVNSAKQALHSTRNGYINGLIIASTGEFSRSITLTGKLNNMIEKGAAPWDMKEVFSKSAKVKYSQKGDWYLTIPFRHATPNALGENSAFNGAQLPTAIHDIVKEFIGGQSLPKKSIPSPFDIPKSRAAISIPEKKINFPEYTHKSSPFAGVTKNEGAYSNITQNSYVSFRRVGKNSDSNSWINSGIQAHNLLDAAISKTDIRTITDNTVDEILSKLL